MHSFVWWGESVESSSRTLNRWSSVGRTGWFLVDARPPACDGRRVFVCAPDHDSIAGDCDSIEIVSVALHHSLMCQPDLLRVMRRTEHARKVERRGQLSLCVSSHGFDHAMGEEQDSRSRTAVQRGYQLSATSLLADDAIRRRGETSEMGRRRGEGRRREGREEEDAAFASLSSGFVAGVSWLSRDDRWRGRRPRRREHE